MSEVISMVRGDDEVWTLNVTEKTSPYGAVDITGCVVLFTVKDKYDGTVIMQKTLALSTPLTGKAELTIDAADTASLANEKQTYVFDIQVTKSAGSKRETLLKGKFIVLPEVTEPEDEGA